MMLDASNDLGERLRSPEFLSFAVARTGLDMARVDRLIYQYTAEVAAGAEMLAGMDLTGKRILEVGAGIGVLSIALAHRGCQIHRAGTRCERLRRQRPGRCRRTHLAWRR